MCVCKNKQFARCVTSSIVFFFFSLDLLPDSAHVPAGGHRDSGILRTIVTTRYFIIILPGVSLASTVDAFPTRPAGDAKWGYSGNLSNQPPA